MARSAGRKRAAPASKAPDMGMRHDDWLRGLAEYLVDRSRAVKKGKQMVFETSLVAVDSFADRLKDIAADIESFCDDPNNSTSNGTTYQVEPPPITQR